MKTLKILISVLFFVSFSFLSCGGDSACQITYLGGLNRVICSGECPSADAPECYVRFRKKGSTDDWEKSGQPGMDKTPDMEFGCYCATSPTVITNETEEIEETEEENN